MSSAKQVVCDLFLSRNCEIISFRQLMSSRDTSGMPASFEAIFSVWSTRTVKISDYYQFNLDWDRLEEEITNNAPQQSSLHGGVFSHI